MNLIQTLVGTIDRPAQAMQRVAAKPRFWLLVAGLVIVSLVVLTAVSAPQAIELANERSQQVFDRLRANMTEEQARVVEQRGSMNLTPTRFWLSALGLGVVTMGLGWVLRGVVVHFSSMALGGVSTWASTFAVGVWSMFPFFVRDIVQAVYIATTKQLIEHQGLAFLVSGGDWLQDSRNLIYTLLSNVDLFALWHLVLLGIGISVATKISRTKGIVLAVIVWALFLGLKLVPVALSTAVTGQFMG